MVAAVVLAAFVGTAAVVLEHGFEQTALSSVQERLKGRIFTLLGLADLDRPQQPLSAEQIPEPALSMPESGQYAQIYDEASDVIWRSRSMLGLTIQSPGERVAGDFVFEDAISSTDEKLFCLSYQVQWESQDSDRVVPYTLQACEGRSEFNRQIKRFKRTMWIWFGGLAAFLLLIQTAILRWGIKPLREVARELTEIESGRQSAIKGQYPRELTALTRNLNTLLNARDSHLQRYRNALGDLAHSLKTPLAVIRSTLESDGRAKEIAEVLREPIDQLDGTIKYQLQRAATAGRNALSPGVEIAPVVDRIVKSLRKVYHARALEVTSEVAREVYFYGDQGDLMEIVGNLADNACKWARTKVVVEARLAPTTTGKRSDVVIRVHDDGPGIPLEKAREAMERGARLDSSVEGHGIGLATVREIVEGAYLGSLMLGNGPHGTLAEARLKFE